MFSLQLKSLLRFLSFVILATVFFAPLSFQNCAGYEANTDGLMGDLDIESNKDLSLQLDRLNNQAAGKKYTCSHESQLGVGQKNMRRHSYQEIKNMIQTLFGESITRQILAELNLLPKDPNIKSKHYPNSLDESFFSRMAVISEKIANIAVRDRAFVSQYGACNELSNQGCYSHFVKNFVARAIKRPLTDSELTIFVNRLSLDRQNEPEVLIASVLMRPDFLHLILNGKAEGKKYKLTPYEVAHRISFATIANLPDEALWQAAANNQLTTLTQIIQHVRRLLLTQAGQKNVVTFFREWMSLEKSGEVSTTEVVNANINPKTLLQESNAEFDQFVRYIVFEKKGYFSDLFLDKTVFPTGNQLARVYGSELWTGGSQLQSRYGHRGIFLRPVSLMGGSNVTQIIDRGVKIRTELLCDSLIFPSLDVIGSRDKDLTPEEVNPQFHSNRTIVSNKTRRLECASCHKWINSLGFLLEHYDSLGRYRSQEKVYDIADRLIATHEIETTSDNLHISDLKGQRVSDVFEFNEYLANSEKVKTCFVTQLSEFTYKRKANSGDSCALSIKEDFASLNDVPVLELLISNIANEEIFYRGK